MTDTNAAPPPALDARDALFVSEFLKDKNPAAACARAGLSPRKAAAMLNNSDVAAEIERRLAAAAAAPAATVSLDALIADARAAYEVAKVACNASAMVAATQLLARLTGRMDGEAPELNETPQSVPSTRHLARAVLGLFREAALEEGAHIGVAGPGETLVRVPTALAATVGGEPASVPDMDAPEVFDNGSTIERVVVVPERRAPGQEPLDAVTKWAVYGSAGELCGYRRNRNDAVALAKSLPGSPVEASDDARS